MEFIFLSVSFSRNEKYIKSSHDSLYKIIIILNQLSYRFSSINFFFPVNTEKLQDVSKLCTHFKTPVTRSVFIWKFEFYTIPFMPGQKLTRQKNFDFRIIKKNCRFSHKTRLKYCFIK